MSIFRRIYESLKDYYENRPPQPWWPDDPVEVIFGAVLVQGTNWLNVARVLETFRKENLLDFKRVLEMDEERLIETIRPTGFQRKKSRRLKEISALFLDRSGGNVERFFARDPETVRSDLLGVKGIGPGAADNILLYAGKIPVYMVDTFTRRILVRHRIISDRARESEIQQEIHRELTPEEEPYGARLFGDFQAVLVRVGRDFCDKSKPECDRCPLAPFLPADGPFGVEETASRQTSAPRLRTDRRAPEPPEPARREDLKPIEELGLNETEQTIIRQLGTDPLSIDSLAFSTGLPIHLVRANLAILEMRKIVRLAEGNKVRRIT